MTSVDDFRADLLAADVEEIVERYFLSAGAAHVDDSKIEYIRRVVAAAYNVATADVIIKITGSAKLGFSIIEKRQPEGPPLPRYRPFGPGSDIDVAVICSPIFEQVWVELSDYARSGYRFPWDSGKLGDYLVSGWLRPDHFPKARRLRNCRTWFPAFNELSRGTQFGRRRVTGGLFYSADQLRIYLGRAVADCQATEALQ